MPPMPGPLPPPPMPQPGPHGRLYAVASGLDVERTAFDRDTSFRFLRIVRGFDAVAAGFDGDHEMLLNNNREIIVILFLNTKQGGYFLWLLG